MGDAGQNGVTIKNNGSVDGGLPFLNLPAGSWLFCGDLESIAKTCAMSGLGGYGGYERRGLFTGIDSFLCPLMITSLPVNVLASVVGSGVVGRISLVSAINITVFLFLFFL